MDKIVGIGECQISDDKNDVIKTFALSSCVALTIYSPSKNVAGMAHIAMPSPNNSCNENFRPYYYATTAVPALINNMTEKYGCSRYDLQIKVFGGADSIQVNDVFQIGRKNLKTVRDALNRLGFKYIAEETGGKWSRTLEMNVSNGKIKLFSLPIKI